MKADDREGGARWRPFRLALSADDDCLLPKHGLRDSIVRVSCDDRYPIFFAEHCSFFCYLLMQAMPIQRLSNLALLVVAPAPAG